MLLPPDWCGLVSLLTVFAVTAFSVLLHVFAAFASPRHLASLRAEFAFLSLGRFPRWRPRLQR